MKRGPYPGAVYGPYRGRPKPITAAEWILAVAVIAALMFLSLGGFQ